jgi:RNA polymerase sigma factor (sigma-70 family)
VEALGDGHEVPGRGAGEPGVLGLAVADGVPSGDHLGVDVEACGDALALLFEISRPDLPATAAARFLLAWDPVVNRLDPGRTYDQVRSCLASTIEPKLTCWKSKAFINDYRRGNSTALDAIYRDHVRAVEGVLTNGFVTASGNSVRGFRDAQIRADLRQEVFLKAFSVTARNNYDSGRDYLPYLLTIARHVLVDTKRQAARLLSLRSSFYTSCSPDEPPVTFLENDMIRITERYLSNMTDTNLRKLYELRFASKMSQVRAAAELGITRQAVRTLERRLKTGLRAELRRYDIEIPSTKSGANEVISSSCAIGSG